MTNLQKTLDPSLDVENIIRLLARFQR